MSHGLTKSNKLNQLANAFTVKISWAFGFKWTATPIWNNNMKWSHNTWGFSLGINTNGKWSHGALLYTSHSHTGGGRAAMQGTNHGPLTLWLQDGHSTYWPLPHKTWLTHSRKLTDHHWSGPVCHSEQSLFGMWAGIRILAQHCLV